MRLHPTPDHLLTASAVLVLAAGVAAAAAPGLLWVLLPAAVLLAAALVGGPTVARRGSARRAARGLAGVLTAALLVTAAGAATTGLTGIEPGWLARSTTVVGLATGVALLGFGAAVAVAGPRRGAGAALALAIPFGLVVDGLVDRLVPFGTFFLEGASLALVLLGAALLRLGGRRPPTGPSATVGR